MGIDRNYYVEEVGMLIVNPYGISELRMEGEK